MKTNNIHIGNLITELLKKQHKSKRQLGNDIGYSPSMAVYLTTRKNIDVFMLQKIGHALRYNFFKHFPINDEETEAQKQETSNKEKKQDEENKKLQEKITELEKQMEGCKRDLLLQKQENIYLKEINQLLKK